MGVSLARFRADSRGDVDSIPRTFRLINARKDGTLFLNLVQLTPVYSSFGQLIRVIACQFGLRDIASAPVAMLQLLQGVVTPHELARLSATPQVDIPSMFERGDWPNPTSCLDLKLAPSVRDRVIADMRQMLTSHIANVSKLIDLASLSKICARVELHMRLKRSQMPSQTLRPEGAPFVAVTSLSTSPSLDQKSARSKQSCGVTMARGNAGQRIGVHRSASMSSIES
jgi:hypothetical protein